MQKVKNWLVKEWKETKLLLKHVPALCVALFVISVVCMNLLANKTIVNETWIALDAGILVSWLSFLSMDIITKHFGPKASTKISILATLVNLLTCLIFWVASVIPTVDDYSGFNTIFGGTWFILLGSTVAFLVSAIINNFTNWGLGHIFKKNPDGKVAYFTRTYVSTFIGQFLDNLIFSVIVFMFFAPIFWDGFCWTFVQCIMCALTGAVVELLFEVVFSPFGYRLTKKWKKDGVGQEYLDAVSL